MNRILLDTHVLLWANAAPERIGPNATRLLHAAEELLVSSVSAAEIAVKRSIGKLQMRVTTYQLMAPLAAVELVLTVGHAETTDSLPLLHRDPFDRLLAGQSVAEDLLLLTADDKLLGYPVRTFDART